MIHTDQLVFNPSTKPKNLKSRSTMNTILQPPVTADNVRVNLATAPILPTVPSTQRRVTLNDEQTDSGLPAPKRNYRPVLKRAGLAAVIILAVFGTVKFAHNWWTIG